MVIVSIAHTLLNCSPLNRTCSTQMFALGFQRLLLSISLILTLVFSAQALAAIEVTVDRTQLAENESLTLFIRSDDVISLEQPDLRDLSVDFEILTQQVRTNIQIINGQNRSEKLWEITLLPKRNGELTIPAITLDGEKSEPITLQVSSAPVNSEESADVFLDSEIDQEGSIYVQQQLIYTLRLYYATSISDHGLTDLELEDALQLQLGNRRDYEARVSGRLYNVAEWRFAIYPQKSGVLSFPAQTFSGRIRQQNRYSLGGLKHIRIQSPEHSINVKPIPDSFPQGHTWLPANKLTLSEQWSGDFSQWQAGSPLTRTLQLKAEGLTAAQLPPLKLSLPDQVRQYPEQPTQEDTMLDGGILGQQSLNIALIPTRPGTLTLPEISIPWWNVEKDQLEYVNLNSLQLSIQADPNQVETQPAPPVAAATSQATPVIQTQFSAGYWPHITAAISAVSLFLIALLWRQQQQIKRLGHLLTEQKSPLSAKNQGLQQEQDIFRKAMTTACQQNDAEKAWQIWQQWKQLETPQLPPGLDIAFTQAINELQAVLYGPQANAKSWQGKELAKIVKQIKPEKETKPLGLAPLYPQ
ncbi:MAG: hypothetical protein CMI12_02410 [Oceanospirillum sp.]|nr:hypothetical protein [Oceanospirillum sp.]